MKTKHFIDNSIFMELVSDLAQKETELAGGENSPYREIAVDEFVYIDEAQEVFDEAYDRIETRLNDAGIYSDNEK